MFIIARFCWFDLPFFNNHNIWRIVVEGEDEDAAMEMIAEKIKSLEIGTIQ